MAASAWFSFLVFAIFTVSTCLADDDVFLVSIDCGSSDDYTDENLIDWSGDGSYIDGGGEARKVQTDSSKSRVLDTLRVFTTRKKNCYYIDSVRQGPVLVRASFYYGNYDGKSSAPTFDLILDGSLWTTVDTSRNSGDTVIAEAIYEMKTGTVSVCVAQTTEDQFPFISALELRGLNSPMYTDDNYRNPTLFLEGRFAYGADTAIRYPDDKYDRLWIPTSPPTGSGLITLSGNLSFDGSTKEDNPPDVIFRTAISAADAYSNITLDLPQRFDDDIQIYINFYFSQVVPLELYQVRSFSIFMDGQSLIGPIKPSNGETIEKYQDNLTYTPNTVFSIVPDVNTTLPPLINALEIFKIGPDLTDGTNKSDVNGLVYIQNTFSVLKWWRGDPCLPQGYPWDWVKCSSESPPRVTALLLGSYGLSKMLPDLTSMDALERIEVQNNSINSPIPDFLGKLPNLKELNLANNNFSGTIPASLLHDGLNLVIKGNPYLLCSSSTGVSCPDTTNSPDTSPSTPSVTPMLNTSKKTRATMSGFTIPSFFIAVFIGLLMGI